MGYEPDVFDEYSNDPITRRLAHQHARKQIAETSWKHTFFGAALSVLVWPLIVVICVSPIAAWVLISRVL